MKNYFYINGKKIAMSNETAQSILKSFNKKPETYKELCDNLFDSKVCYISNKGHITTTFNVTDLDDPNNATEKNQLESILNLNKLLNVAKYLNGDKKVKDFDYHWYIYHNRERNNPAVIVGSGVNGSHVYFQSEEDAKYAIKLLGIDAIKSALMLQE